MDINKRVMKFRQKCVGKLNRQDAEYFLDKCTIKDLNAFISLARLKQIDFNDEFEFETTIVRYLQILMVLSSVSDDPRDVQLVDKYMSVPFECEEIIKRRPPYKNPDNIDLIFQLIKEKYPLPAYWESGGLDTENILAATPKQSEGYMNRILEYYSTPIVAMAAVLGIKPKDFDFLEELKRLLKLELQRQDQAYRGKLQEKNEYIKVMNWVVKSDFKKAA